MTNEELIQLLNEARHEITALRTRNQLLEAKVHVMEFFEAVFRTMPYHEAVAMSPDVCWHLQRTAAELGLEPKAKAPGDGQ